MSASPAVKHPAAQDGRRTRFPTYSFVTVVLRLAVPPLGPVAVVLPVQLPPAHETVLSVVVDLPRGPMRVADRLPVPSPLRFEWISLEVERVSPPTPVTDRLRLTSRASAAPAATIRTAAAARIMALVFMTFPFG